MAPQAGKLGARPRPWAFQSGSPGGAYATHATAAPMASRASQRRNHVPRPAADSTSRTADTSVIGIGAKAAAIACATTREGRTQRTTPDDGTLSLRGTLPPQFDPPPSTVRLSGPKRKTAPCRSRAPSAKVATYQQWLGRESNPRHADFEFLCHSGVLRRSPKEKHAQRCAGFFRGEAQVRQRQCRLRVEIEVPTTVLLDGGRDRS